MPVSTEQFLDSISISGILSAEEINNIRAGVTTRQPPVNPQALAQELVKAGKLTKFQAQAIYQGKGKGLVCGDYVFLDKIGVGGMGQVFKARHNRMNRIVAIKILAPHASVGDKAKALQRFQQEVETAAKLMHPNIVTAYDANEAQGLQYLVMEYVAGQDLHTSLKPDKKLPLDQVLDIIIQAARGLEYAHSQGVIHRDIKPANLLVNAKGQVKVLDMGLARVADTLAGADRAATDGLTQTGEVMGTVDYMAPEQARNTREADARADIYSLGCTFYRLATGQLPFEESTMVKKFLAHIEKPVPQLSQHCENVSARTQRALERMMAKQPEQRFQSMTDVITELEACRAGTPEEEHSPLVTDEPLHASGGSSFLSKPGGTGLTHRLPPIPGAANSAAAGDAASDRRAARAEATAKAKKRRMLLIAGGIAAAVLLVIINLVVFFGGRREPDATAPAVAAIVAPPETNPSEEQPETAKPTIEEPKPATTPVASVTPPVTPPIAPPVAPPITPPVAPPVTPQPQPAPSTPAPVESAPAMPLPTPQVTKAPTPNAPTPNKVVTNATGVSTDLLYVASAAPESLKEGWRVDADGLVQVPATSGPVRLELPVSPPPIYELQVVAEPLNDKNGNLQIGMVVGEARAVFVVDRPQQATGFEPVRGKGFRDNSNFVKHSELWERNEPLYITCRVKPDAVQVTLNGQRLVTWQGDFRDLSMARNSGDHTKLFVAGAAGGGNTTGSFKFKRIEVIPLGYEPKPVPPAPAIAAVSTIVVDRLSTLPSAATAKDRADAIHKLRQDAGATEDEALRYALLSEAIKLAVASEQMSLLTQLTQDMRRSFAVDAVANFSAQLTEITARNRPPLERKELALNLLEAAASELDAERFELCGSLIKAASDAAAKTPDLELKKEIRNRELEAEGWQKLFAPIESAQQTLATNPADPLASYQLGAYLASRWKYWPAALQLMSKGSQEAVKAAADAELRLRHDPGSAGVIGGLWLDASEATDFPERAVYLDHARPWLAVGAKRLKPGEQAKLSGKFKKLDTEVRRVSGTAFLTRHPLRAFQFGGHWYEFVPTTANWRDARAKCEARGGQLVSLESMPECQAVYQLAATAFDKPDQFGFWIGATEEGHDQQFVWTNGAPMTFSDWANNEPSKGPSEAVMANRTGVGVPLFKWQDAPPTDWRTYVCEWDR